MSPCNGKERARMIRVWIESPYAGDVEKNVAYARQVMAWALQNGYAPMCSHLVYTQPGILDDNIKSERRLGIESGFEWQKATDQLWVATDLGISGGMRQGIKHWLSYCNYVETIKCFSFGGSPELTGSHNLPTGIL